MLPLEFTHPLLLVGLVVLPILVWYFYRGLTDFARWQRITSLVLRAAIVVLLVLGLAGLTWLAPTKELFVVFALDDSLSVGSEGKEEMDKFLDAAVKAAGPNRVAFLRFGKEPGLVRNERDQALTEPPPGTNIAAALEVATAAIPPSFVPQVVLLSDGNQTSGDALKAALRANIPVSTVPLSGRSEPEVQVAAVNVPAQVREGEPFNVEVIINSNHDDEGDIEIARGPFKLGTYRHKIKKGENRILLPRQSLTTERFAQYTVRIKNFSDRLLDNNAASGLVYSNGKPRVLLIESDPKQAKHLGWALEQEGIPVDTRPPSGMPDNLADLQNYECLLLSNVPATSLSQRQMDVARTYVQDLGGGLIMLGGDQSFGLGGYYKTVIEEILPVRSDFEKEKEKPSLAMVIVIDKSGSMGGQKIELAKDAAKGAVELLGPKDKIGVLAFDGETYAVAEVQPAANKTAVIDRIAGIEAGGGTTMAPAMEQAHEWLSNTVAKLKHVIILTDGVSSPGPFEEIAQNMASSKITITTVGVGEDTDRKLLEEIARIGKGRNYQCDDPASVPQIFAKETVTASKAALNEQPFLPQVIRPTQVLAGIDLANAPFLLGYVTTRLKPTSEPILATEKGDPLLVWWRYGLGMTVAFTSDAKSRWAAEWVSWPGFGKFWAQVIRHAMRKSDARGVFVQVTHRDGKAQVALDAVDPAGRFLKNAETDLSIIRQGEEKQEFKMTQVAPGRYQAEFTTPASGTYHLELGQKAGGAVNRQARALVVGYDEEFRLKPTNDDLLQNLARVTGGQYQPTPEAVFAAPERTANRTIPLWPTLIIVALMLFVIDVALRRIDFMLLFGGYRKGATQRWANTTTR